MPTIKKDFKNLQVPQAPSFELGFMTAIAVMAAILKLAGVIV